ncbi:DNA-directed RNA polymerase sigma-70 factor [Terrihabitans soli]|uniref:DNA-directed RNA polymerase sigma-70 factor n=1 Tax=Terrihabitans soli TaxID=708113 RepID=A0A6S6QYB6_9HYPH|nr:sigma-70 family RNA polymerase sigma factor [Terrihabitans soli]BCJ91568.1 DNA-directed RNA polymerase sigma-70 factor [Terrihabitans soli]
MSGKGFNVTGQLPALKRYARALTRDETEAEDLVHDTVLRAYEGRGSFRRDGDLKRWLFSVLHNTFVSGRRSARAQQKRHDSVAELTEMQTGASQEASLRLNQIRAAFSALPGEQREVLHLVAIEGLAYGEAAEILGVPLGTLMSRLGRARAALRAFEAGETNVVSLKLVRGGDGEK